jgi:hypothetical protein
MQMETLKPQNVSNLCSLITCGFKEGGDETGKHLKMRSTVLERKQEILFQNIYKFKTT